MNMENKVPIVGTVSCAQQLCELSVLLCNNRKYKKRVHIKLATYNNFTE